MVYRLMCVMLIVVAAATATAQYPGYPQRDFLGKTYVILPYEASGPFWYAGNGIVAGPNTRPVPRPQLDIPLIACGSKDVIVKKQVVTQKRYLKEK